MSLTILSVAYPLAEVSPDSTGGSEQILATLDGALHKAGHRSIVIAPQGSKVAGELHPIPKQQGVLDDAAKARAGNAAAKAIASVLASQAVDLVHLHGIDFPTYMPEPGVPVLVTLHLPPDWYPPEALCPTRANTWFNCVSDSQQSACPPDATLVSPIPNGVPVERLAARHAKRNVALFLGRICPEKGVHLAVEAAKRAGVPLLIAGEVYRYAAHQSYFDTEVAPRLDGSRRFIGPIGLARKRRLLTAARCLLVPSLAAETSSLVAREAAACGTAVVAFPNGALRDTVEPGRTGFLVDTVEGMAEAIGTCSTIDPAACRAVARARFSETTMIAAYLALYARLATRPAP